MSLIPVLIVFRIWCLHTHRDTYLLFTTGSKSRSASPVHSALSLKLFVIQNTSEEVTSVLFIIISTHCYSMKLEPAIIFRHNSAVKLFRLKGCRNFIHTTYLI